MPRGFFVPKGQSLDPHPAPSSETQEAERSRFGQREVAIPEVSTSTQTEGRRACKSDSPGFKSLLSDLPALAPGTVP